MTALRHHLLRYRILAAWLVAAALVMKIVVPAGYMAATSAGSITIEVCSGFGVRTMVVAMPGAASPGEPHGPAEMPCAFSALSASSLAAADPLILALAVAFVMATAVHIVAPGGVTAPAFLRPPLRGPPAAF